jgi:predicted metalloprotease
VRVELQADCFAGVWARRSQQAQGWRLEPGDIEQALNAASQIGDDKLQKQSRGPGPCRKASPTAPARSG